MLWQLPKHTRESTMMPFKSASKNVNNLMQRSKKKGLKRKSIMNSLPLEQKSSYKIKSPNIGPSMRSLSTKEVKEPSSLTMAPNVSKGTDSSLLLILNRKRKQLILNRKRKQNRSRSALQKCHILHRCIQKERKRSLKDL